MSEGNILKSAKKNLLIKNKFTYIAILVILVGYFVFSIYKSSAIKNQQSWIKATTDNLIKDAKPFRFIGASAVNLVFYDDWDLDIEKAIRTAKENNISVLRIYMDWGWGKDDDLDRIFDIASRYGVYIILAFTDCCCSGDYANLKKYFEVHAPFCNITNKQSIRAFKKLIKQIIERKNSINGRIYRDDPTILAWEIVNELEYWHFDYIDVRNWTREIATYIKSLDINHLVTIGISTDRPEFDKDSILYNLFNIPELDFISFHFYPTVNISNSGEAMLQSEYGHQIELRAKRFLSMHKPVIMGEFGFSNSAELNLKTKTNPETSDFYNEVIKQSMDSAFFAGASGVMFWGWGVPEEKNVPMWWSQESHSSVDKKFCNFIKNYHIPEVNER